MYKIVRVKWVDSAQLAEWMPIAEAIQQVPFTCCTVGYLLSDEGDYLILTSTLSETHALGYVMIPRVAIVSTEVLETPPATNSITPTMVPGCGVYHNPQKEVNVRYSPYRCASCGQFAPGPPPSVFSSANLIVLTVKEECSQCLKHDLEALLVACPWQKVAPPAPPSLPAVPASSGVMVIPPLV